MAFIDEIKIVLAAGDGGHGIVHWHHEKNKEYGGPDGGNGGRGGDVYAHAIRDIGVLARYRTVKCFNADRAGNGEKNTRHGKNGKDLIMDFPIGSVLTNTLTGKKVELLRDDEKILLLKGGNGGLGNEHFKASTNVRPREFTLGKPGEKAEFHIELQLVADAGIIGLPNAGKSSLLNTLTNANAKVGSYAFTTLEPNLGDMWGYILADIPGLIEGAAEGKGLGDKFLRHIRRTKAIIHCLSLESENLTADYEVIRGELGKYDAALLAKDEVIVLTKTDLVDAKTLKRATAEMTKICPKVYSVSTFDSQSVKQLSDRLVAHLKSGAVQSSLGGSASK